MNTLVGVDIGGTFTDLVLLDEDTGQVRTAKVPTTPADPSRGLLDGLNALAVRPSDIGLIVHGTTVATNAVLERKGARVGLIMTEGFRDVLELRRRDRPETYGLRGAFQPLVPRDLRCEVPERTDYRGQVHQPPDPAQLRQAAARLLERGAEAVVVSFLNAYANPANEAAARETLETVWPNTFIVTGSEVVPEIREFERTSTAVLNGYVQPLIARYLDNLLESLTAEGYQQEVLLIQSNGGVMSQQVGRRLAVNTILSGPAAGVAAVGRLGQATGEENLIACDVGGTSLDIAVISSGQPATARDAALEYGLPIRVPMLDIRTLGAGGGSIAWIDRAGMLNIGPESAGADPGPVCYGQGGQRPTVTDANLVLGRINPGRAIGREADYRLDREAAATAIGREAGKPLGLDTEQAAWAILQVANHKIAAGIRALTVEQGLDPRDYALVAYGGGGPLHAGALLRELELGRVIVPPWPGINSALGCLIADVRHDFARSLNELLEQLPRQRLREVLEAQESEGRQRSAAEGIALERVEVRHFADMNYDGQIHEVRTPLPGPDCTTDQIAAAFAEAYAAQYGEALGERPVRVVTLRTTVLGVRPPIDPRPPALAGEEGQAADALTERRPVCVAGGFVECPVYSRERLAPGAELAGPAVIEQPDATTVVEPGMTCRVDGHGNLIIREGA